MAQVEALCISEKKGVQKRPIDSAVFRANYGIEGDAHGGDWHRQASPAKELLDACPIRAARGPQNGQATLPGRSAWGGRR